MMGKRAPAARLQMKTQSWEERLADQAAVRASGGTWAGWRRGLTGTSWSSTKCLLGAHQVESSLAGEDLGILLGKLNVSQQYPALR